MKLALLAKKNDLAEVPAKLADWGFEVELFEDGDTLLDWARSNPDLELVLIKGVVGPEIENCILRLRQFPYYLYLLYIETSPSQTPPQLFKAGLDEVVKCQDILKLRLLALERFFKQHRTRTFRKPRPEGFRPEVLNLNKGLGYAQKDRVFYQELLTQLVILGSQLLKSPEGGLRPWETFGQQAGHLGAHELEDWVDRFFGLKRRRMQVDDREYKELLDLYPGLLGRLSMALAELTKANFFTPLQQPVIGSTEGIKVLIVEDLPHNRLLLKQMLKRLNANCVEACDGQAAVERFKEDSFDLVVMDINMPIMDGFEATRRIRQFEEENQQTRTPILALTALAMRGDRELCLAAGCDNYLPKPIDVINLFQLVGELTQTESEPKQASTKTFSLGIYTQNQVYRFLLEKIINELDLSCQFLEGEKVLLEAVEKSQFNLILIDLETDWRLTYLIRDQYPTQALTLIGTLCGAEEIWLARFERYIAYPFDRQKIAEVVEHHSKQLQQQRNFEEMIDDFNSLRSLKSQVSVEDSMAASGDQLAVWQKSIRKIGGDLVLSQHFSLHGRYGLILADVSGHDVKSGYTASWFAGLVKGVWRSHSHPFDLLVYLNKLFETPQFEEDKRYICALVLLWDPLTRVLHWANSGIPDGLLIKPDGTRQSLNWRGIPIGMFPELEMFDQGKIDLEPGSSLILATDGVLEAVPNDLIGQLSLKGDSPVEMLEGIVDFVTRSMEIKDDLTLAVFKAKPLEARKGYHHLMPCNLDQTQIEVAQIKAYLDQNSALNFDWPMTSVAIKEALMNAVEHGNKNAEHLPVWVDAWVENNRLNLLVSDQGPGFDLSVEKKRIEKEGPLRIQGRGIQLMENIAKEVEFFGSSCRMIFESVDLK